MNGEAFPELFDDPGIPQTIDIDPGHGLGIPERETFGNVVDLLLLEMRLVIIDYRDPDRGIDRLAVYAKDAWRLAGSF
jgi:hypothetical protein